MVESVTSIFSPEGDRDVIDLLKEDHDRVKSLFEKVKANEDGNNKETFLKIKQELELHTHVEEQIFYPHLLENGNEDLQDIVREGLEEHGQVKTLLPEIAELSGDDDTFKAKLKVLIENVEHHVEEEEGEMFPMVKDQIDEIMRVRLGSLIKAEKERYASGASRIATA